MAIDKDVHRSDGLPTRIYAVFAIIGMFGTSTVAHFNLCSNVFASGSISDCDSCAENIWSFRCNVRRLGNFGSILQSLQVKSI